MRFLAEFKRLVDDCTFAHEGRHAIDSGAYEYEEKEFRARLSEVAFAPAPGLCLASSFAPDTGELAREGVNIDMISTSEIKISVVIDLAKAEQSMRAVHAAFLG